MSAVLLGGQVIRSPLHATGSGSTSEAASYPGDGYPTKQYAEVLAHIQQRAFFPVPREDLRYMTTSSLNAYLAKKDPYSSLLTAEEYASFRAASSSKYAGIGLDVEKRRNGDIICYPVPEGPAAIAGVKPGERLLSLDGISTSGMSLPAIVALAAGEAGTGALVELESRSGQRRLIVVTRSKTPKPGISDYTYRSTRIIKLSTFTSSTRHELDYLISNWRKNKPIIIDLRGCGGGDFYAAVDSAMLFLKKGEPIISVRQRSGTRSYTDTTARPPPMQRVFLWQDEFTASAAEIFLAALTENARAISIGMTSAGKGTRQDLVELKGGGALILTTGYLVTPRGVPFDGRGIAPMREIEDDALNTEAFYNKTAA